MSLASVREFFARHAPEIEVVETHAPTPTVVDAARVLGVAPGQIAKTLSLWLGDEVILLVMAGDTRIDNRRYKAHFGVKPRMLGGDDVAARTGHPVGGVCPFGLPGPMRVCVDASLRRFDVVWPAAGSVSSMLRIAPDRIVALTSADWVDVGSVAA